MAADGQRFCLKWNDFRNSVTAVFEDLRQDEELVDITLCCEGKKVKAHRMMLSACSPYFRDLLKENPCQHPVFFLKDTTYIDLRAVIEFVYNGEVNVTQAQLSSFLKTAEMLQVRGLTGDDDKDSASAPPSPRTQQRPAPPRPFSRPAPAAPSPVSRPPVTPIRRPMVPTAPPHPLPPPPLQPPPPPINSVATAGRTAPPPAESPPASPSTKRRRLYSGSGSGSNDGLETAAPAAPSPVSRPPVTPIRRPTVPAAPSHPPPPDKSREIIHEYVTLGLVARSSMPLVKFPTPLLPPPINRVATAGRRAPPPAESRLASPSTKRRRQGSISGSNDGVETSTAASSPAATSPAATIGAPPPPPMPGSTPMAVPPLNPARSGSVHSGAFKVEADASPTVTPRCVAVRAPGVPGSVALLPIDPAGSAFVHSDTVKVEHMVLDVADAEDFDALARIVDSGRS